MNITHKIKKFIPVRIKRQIQLLFMSPENNKWSDKICNNRINVIVFLAGFYQNIGDMAITYAQVEFLKSLYKDTNIILVPSTQTYSAAKALRKVICSRDLITITGGGNMDDAYPTLDDARLFVVKKFPNNKIVCFPQTVFYSDSSKGNRRRKNSRKVYTEHRNITLFAREKDSYKRMKDYFPDVDIRISPDIVFYINRILPNMERKGAICCLRSDKEKNIDDGLQEKITQYVKNYFKNVKFVDTVDVPLEMCSEEKYITTLNEFLMQIKSARLVVTDRLHCLIFCVITGTPCVVLDNSNHKVRSIYETWLMDTGYVKLLYENNFEEFVKSMNYVLKIKKDDCKFDFTAFFEDLKSACEQSLRKENRCEPEK